MDESGDPEMDRFRQLFEAHYADVVRYARRRCGRTEDADDIVAETFTVAWRRLNAVPKDGELPWLYGVARKVLANQRRSERRWLGLIEKLRQGLEVSTPAHEPTALTEVLATLRREDQELLRLAAWEGLNHADIGMVLGISANAAGIRVHRAKKRLAEEMARQGFSPRKDQTAAGQTVG